MPYRPISNDLKECAICLWGSGWRLEDICDALGVSSRSCYRWRQILEEHGSVNRPPSPLTGHAQTVTRALLTAMEDLFSEHPDLYLDEICTWLAVKHDIDLSTSSLSRTLNSVGLSRKMLQKLASERNELWHSDKNERTYARHYGHAPCGRRAQLRDVFVRGTRYSLCAALTTEGYIASHVIEGTYDTQQFYDFIAEEVLPQMNPFPAEHSVLILDNCRIHRNDALVELVENAGMCRFSFVCTNQYECNICRVHHQVSSSLFTGSHPDRRIIQLPYTFHPNLITGFANIVQSRRIYDAMRLKFT
ncbi:hypothetical protein PISMIDRAFT_88936 [Pisolithus microcarpus 441]|uniref:Tc1-like transposase DDE domain-containing protein n=1 Tax=Pisolithus microcarpus 441 TaxID=765257 RepID=A0A0D0A4T8_9AGAM|nr:hypothetical protein PISMIDRAFT_88936 [Pisolithus microcarpus 441]